MILTKENKKYIDSLEYEELLSRWRFAPSGNPWFEDETGDYWGGVINIKKQEVGQDEAVRTSKDIGW